MNKMEEEASIFIICDERREVMSSPYRSLQQSMAKGEHLHTQTVVASLSSLRDSSENVQVV